MMTRKFFLLIFILVFVPASLAWTYTPPQCSRMDYNFNPSWKVFAGDPAGAQAPDYDDSSWKSVTLPYAWNEDSAFKVGIRDLPTGIAWYRKHFVLPVGSAGKNVFLEFQGIRQAGEFYLNGRWIGRSQNGVMAFGFDITPFVKLAPQVNVLAARIDNSWNYKEQPSGVHFEWNDRNFYANYGGINKNVFLHITGKLYQTLPLYANLRTTGVYVYARHFNIPEQTAAITAESQIRNDYTKAEMVGYKAVVVDMNGNVVKVMAGKPQIIAPGQTALASATATVKGLHFWSWGYGYLYNVYTILTVHGKAVDVVKTRTGFRKTGFNHGEVWLNDRVIEIKGYGQRSTNEWPALGNCVPAWVSDFSSRMILQDNGDLVRWMHVTPWKQDIESFDRLGLMETMPAGDAERDASGRQWQQRLRLMRDAMIYNRNDPSIIFYEAGNNQVSQAHMLQVIALRNTWDPYGGRAAGSRNMQGSKVAEYGGEMLYIDKSATKPLWAMEYSRDEALRKWWDRYTPPYHHIPRTAVFKKAKPGQTEAPAYAYNRDQDSQAIEDVIRWYDYWRERPGTGLRVNAGGTKIIFSDTNTHFRGTQNYRRSGAVDPVRLPKDSYYANQVMWGGWVNAVHPTAYIIGHWNYAPGVVKNEYVVSSAERVRLFVNGHSLGWGQRTYHFLFTFPHVIWKPGVIEAVGYNAQGREECVTEKKTAGPPAALRLTLHTGPDGLQADGGDLALVDVEVVDRAGERCPTALNMVHFSLTGPGDWRGGIAQSDDRPDNYILSKNLPVQCGINRVIIRSEPTAGHIVLTASVAGLQPATLDIVSHPVAVVGGLETQIPGANLPSYLKRGPTPSGSSLTITRIPVLISHADAGANSDKAYLSYDDNETTAWSNDGKLSTAWIQYYYAHPAALTQLTMKMSDWRRRSYPICVTVDGHLVYQGATPRSLGYVTLPLRPVMGDSLKIILTGPAVDEPRPASAGGPVGTKTAAQPLVAASANIPDPNAPGLLSIIEAELYESIPAKH